MVLDEDDSDAHMSTESDIETITGESDASTDILLYADSFGDVWLNEMERDHFHATLDDSESEDARPQTTSKNSI